jgi:hypothetical protein
LRDTRSTPHSALICKCHSLPRASRACAQRWRASANRGHPNHVHPLDRPNLGRVPRRQPDARRPRRAADAAHLQRHRRRRLAVARHAGRAGVQRALAAAQVLGLVDWAERRVRAGWRWLRSSNLYRFVVPDGAVPQIRQRDGFGQAGKFHSGWNLPPSCGRQWRYQTYWRRGGRPLRRSHARFSAVEGDFWDRGYGGNILRAERRYFIFCTSVYFDSFKLGGALAAIF